MSKYTAEQVQKIRAAHYEYMREYNAKPDAAVLSVLDDFAVLLREREPAKAGVTDKIIAGYVERVACVLSGAPFPSARSYAKAREISDLMLEAVAPMLASARVPDGWQLVPREPTSEMVKAGDDCGFRSYTGTWSITPDACWQAMLAAAGEPNHDA